MPPCIVFPRTYGVIGILYGLNTVATCINTETPPKPSKKEQKVRTLPEFVCPSFESPFVISIHPVTMPLSGRPMHIIAWIQALKKTISPHICRSVVTESDTASKNKSNGFVFLFWRKEYAVSGGGNKLRKRSAVRIAEVK